MHENIKKSIQKYVTVQSKKNMPLQQTFWGPSWKICHISGHVDGHRRKFTSEMTHI